MQGSSLGGNIVSDRSLFLAAQPSDFEEALPTFAGSDDFHLADTIPSTHKGLDISNLPTTDFDGNPRVVGCPDIKAYESTTVISTECVVGSREVWSGLSQPIQC